MLSAMHWENTCKYRASKSHTSGLPARARTTAVHLSLAPKPIDYKVTHETKFSLYTGRDTPQCEDLTNCIYWPRNTCRSSSQVVCRNMLVPSPATARMALSRHKDDTRKARAPGARLRVRSPTPGELTEPYWEASTS